MQPKLQFSSLSSAVPFFVLLPIIKERRQEKKFLRCEFIAFDSFSVDPFLPSRLFLEALFRDLLRLMFALHRGRKRHMASMLIAGARESERKVNSPLSNTSIIAFYGSHFLCCKDLG